MATKSQKIPFGLKGELMVSVAEVQSGLACGCHCPACGEPLIARKGLKNVHHFAHHSDADCPSAFETSVHLMAKQIIAQEKRLTTPQLTLRERDTDSDGFPTWQELTIPEANVRFSSVETEKEVSNLKIDAVGRNHRGAELLIEFFVTHEVPEEKKDKIRDLRKSAIEIDLSDVSYSVTEAKLRYLIVESTKNKRWISGARYHSHREKLLAKKESKEEVWPERKGVLQLRNKYRHLYP